MRMARQKWYEMFRYADRPHAGPAAAVRNTESFVQIQMAHVCTDKSGRGQPDLRVHVRAIHINLTAVHMNDAADFLDGLLKYAVRTGIGDHETGQFLFMRLGFRAKVGHINVSVGIASHGDDLHPGHRGACRIRAVRGGWDQTDIAMRLAPRFVIGTDDEQSGNIRPANRRSAAMKCQRSQYIPRASPLGSGKVSDNRAPATTERTGWIFANSGHETGNISAAAFNFIVQEPSGIIEAVNDKSRDSNRLM